MFGRYPVISAAHNLDLKLLKWMFEAGGRLDVVNDDGASVANTDSVWIIEMFIRSKLSEYIEVRESLGCLSGRK